MPKVSVLTPIYNTDLNHLKEMIDSIINQTFEDFEFIILNDSPDNKVLKEFVLEYIKFDKRIIYHENNQNIGIAESRNNLIRLAKGEYLAVCDHDDISVSDRFELQVKYLDEHPDVGVVGGKIAYFKDNFLKEQKNLIISEIPEDDIDIKIGFTHGCIVPHPCSMIRKSILLENNIFYKKKFSPAEDYMLWIDLVNYTKFHNIQKTLLYYRDFNGNTSHIQSDKMSKADLEIKKLFFISNPCLFNLYDKLYFPKYTLTVNLFKFIPILKIKRRQTLIKIYLFNFLPILKIRKTFTY